LCEEYRSLSSSLWSFHHSPVAARVWGPNNFLNTPFSNPSACVPTEHMDLFVQVTVYVFRNRLVVWHFVDRVSLCITIT
jgi:hypothetical protein